VVGPSRKVALLVETSNSYAREVLHGIRAWLREHEPWAIRFSENSRGAGLPPWLRRWKGDGIIARVENPAIARGLKATGLPVVDVSAALVTPVFPRVATDSRAAMALAAEHFLERGFRNFGFCGDPRFLWAARRGEFFAAHLHGAGFGCDRFAPPTRATAEAQVQAIARWLRRLPLPTAVLACYDVRGQQVLEACQLAGLAVPEEVAVLGVHNDELLCDLSDPPLSSVIPNARRAGYEAAALLARLMAGEPLPPTVTLIAPLGVATRQSTDVVAVPDARLSAAVRFIRAHAGEAIDVGDVLRHVPMSRTLLERKFKRWLGHTPHEHILRTRLGRVKELLVSTDLPIGAIAERTGFAHSEYLSVAFRRLTGQPPGAFRTRHRAGNPGPSPI
jgi:LacI family transcriptional regulator